MHRIVMLIALTCALALGSGAAIAQEASPEATPTDAFAGLGLPELSVTVTTDAYEGIPEQLEAGRYLVTVNAAADTEFGGGVAFIQPAGLTAEEFLGALAGPPDETGVGDATPMAEASPADGGEGAPPAFIYDSTFAGGAYANAGESAQMVLDLTPGEWIAWGDDPEAPQAPVVFEVTGEMPADLPEPEAGATIIMGEYLFQISEGALVTGPQVIKLENPGAQPHFLGLVQGPDGLTKEQVQVALDEEMQAEMTGTPVAYSDFNPDEEITDEGVFTATQSTGTSTWIAVDLAPGTYILVCFFPDISDGIPHAYHGMVEVVEVTG